MPTLPRHRRAIAIAMVVVFGTQSISASANMSGLLDAMYMSNVTSPAFIENQGRGLATFGSATFRTPIKDVTLFSFDPPRMRAGCSGIDISGGAFQFLSTDAIVTLLRQIGANMIPLLFKYALSMIDPNMAKEIGEFMSKLQELGQHRMNSCKIANNLFDMAVKKTTSTGKTEDLGQQSATESGAEPGFGGWMKSLFAGATSVVDQVANVGVTRSDPMAGNLTWNLLADSQAHTSLASFSGGLSEMDAALVVVSLLGTTITTCNDGTDSKGKCKTSDSKPSMPEPFDAAEQFSLRRLIEVDKAQGEPLKRWTCPFDSAVSPTVAGSETSTGCTHMVLADWNFPGTVDYAKRMFYGTGPSGALDASTAAADSIYGKVTSDCRTSGGGCGLTTQQKSFLAAIGLDYLNLLKVLRRTESIKGYTDALIPYAGLAMGVRFGEAAMQVWRQAKSPKGYQLPDKMIEAEKRVATDLNVLRREMHEKETKLTVYATAAATITAARKMQVGVRGGRAG